MYGIGIEVKFDGQLIECPFVDLFFFQALVEETLKVSEMRSFDIEGLADDIVEFLVDFAFTVAEGAEFGGNFSGQAVDE